MPLVPGYGETPVSGDELDALLPSARELLGAPITRAAVYDLEQAVQEQVVEEQVTAVLEGRVRLDALLTDSFLRDLHAQLYQDVWSWAGLLRKSELNIGVAPEQVAVELRASMDTIRYRWEHTSDWTARELGIVAHAEAVRIHPFVDGNGRSTRLLADLVFVAAQDGEAIQQYDWEIDKTRYISLLRKYDASRDIRELAAFIPIRQLEE
jgi:fido (protein-threonine AMPylation protein)